MNMETSVRIDMTGNLERKADRNMKAMERMSKRSQRQLRGLSRVAATTGRMLDRMGNRYTAMLFGAAGLGSAKGVVDLQRRFTRLGIQANKDAGVMDRLKKKIYEVAQSPDIRVDPSQITSAIEAIIEKTGDLKFAEDNIRNIGIAIQATGSGGKAIGELLAEFQKMDIKVPSEVLNALDTLNKQGKEGAFTLENLAALGPRVITAYTAMGRGGGGALKEMGAVLQVIRKGTGSSEQAATSFEALMRVLGDAKKVGILQKGGIKIFDQKELEKGRKVLRPINELMAEIVGAVKGDKTIIQRVLGDSEAVRAFNAAVTEFGLYGGIKSLDQYMAVVGDGTTTVNDSARAAKDSAAAMQSLYTAWQQFADDELAGPIQALADALNSLNAGELQTILKAMAGIATAGAGAYGLRKLMKTQGFQSLQARSAAGPAATAAASATASYLGGQNGPRTPRAGLLKRFGARALPMLGAAGTAAAGLSGAAVVGYGVGTAINAGISELIQALTGDESMNLGRWIYKATHDAEERKSVDIGGTLKIDINSKGEATVRDARTNSPEMEMDIEAGVALGGL